MMQLVDLQVTIASVPWWSTFVRSLMLEAVIISHFTDFTVLMSSSMFVEQDRTREA